MSDAAAFDPRLGSTLEGYRIEGALGAGAMGVVYRARRLRDDLPAVVKFPQGADPGLRARFLREGQALLRAPRHANLLRVLALAEHEGAPALITELVEGRSLRRALQREGPLPPLEAARVGRDLASGLAALHGAGILHRDLKPANVILTPAGQARIIDFGLAKELDRTAITLPEQLLGTAPYMAPERWEGPSATPAGDAFSLGVIVYELITGRRPYRGGDPEQLLADMRRGEPPWPSAGDPAVPRSLEALLAQLLAPDPRHRYASLALVAGDFERVLHEAPVPAPALLARDGEVALELWPRARWVLGSAAQEGRIEGPGVAERHALLRRLPQGYELRDLRSAGGTFLSGAPVEAPTWPQDGQGLRLGQVELRFVDPRQPGAASARPPAPPPLADPERAPVGALLREVLLARGDPRALLIALERCEEDPVHEAAEAARLRAALGEASAREVWALREARRAASREQGRRLLATHLGAEGGWPAGWAARRAELLARGLPVQLGPPAGPGLALRVVAGEAEAQELPLTQQGVLLLGRGTAAHLRLSHPSVSRWHASLLRLHRRWLLVDGGRGRTRRAGAAVEAAFLRSGDELELSRVRLRVEPLGPPPAGLDPESCASLLERPHPAACALLLDLLAATPRAEGLEPALAEELRQAALARAREARAALAQLLGQDLGPEPAPWRAACRARPLPPQLRAAEGTPP